MLTTDIVNYWHNYLNLHISQLKQVRQNVDFYLSYIFYTLNSTLFFITSLYVGLGFNDLNILKIT